MSSSAQIDHWLDQAISLHQKGQADKARPLYERVLVARPDDSDANHLLGLIDQSEGRFDSALARMTNARQHDPGNAAILSNLGGLYRELGRFEDAIGTYKAGLALNARMPQLHNNLGVAYQDADQHELAISSLEKALSLNPDYAEAYNNLGASLLKTERLPEAAGALEKALERAPNYAKALGNLGTTYARMDRHKAAVEAFQLALSFGPVAGFYDNLGISLHKLERFEEALAAHERAAELEPQNADYLVHQVAPLMELSREDTAMERIDEVLQRDERHAAAHYLKGLLLGCDGDTEGSISAFRTAVGIDPELVDAHRMVARAKRFPEEDTITREIRAAYAGSEPDSQARMHLAFALGKIEEDQKSFRQAFAFFLEGNAIRRRGFTYSTSEATAKFDQLRATFTPELFERLEGQGHDSSAPIFIIGMPRSGTTLVESIISSHPDVTDGGELTFFGEAANRAGLSDGAYPPNMRFEDAEGALLKTAGHYLARVDERISAPGRFTDKLPANFFYAGLIHLAFPNAKIVHCRRSPLDTCLSMFKTHFSTNGLAYTYDLTELGEHYMLYQELMRHWDAVMPGVICTLDYESLVANPEAETRKLIAHCGLDWDDACLSSHTSRRRVRTASLYQVRQPIYATSVGLAECYGDALAPLIKALEADQPPDGA